MSNIQTMNEVQLAIAKLQEKGWTVAALADKLDQSISTVEKWKSGERNPANSKSVIEMMHHIAKQKRVPKKRRYAKGSRRYGK